MLAEQICEKLTEEDVTEIVTEGIEKINNVYKINLKEKENSWDPDLYAFINDRTIAYIDATNNSLVVSELQKNRT